MNPMAPYPWKLVTIDIDGTLTTVHGWLRIAAACGREVDYQRAHAAIERGIQDEDAHLRALFGLAVGMSRAELSEVLDHTPKLAGIEEAVEALHRRGARVGLLTHNPRYVIDWYSRTFGFDGGSGGWGSNFLDGHVAPPDRVRADKVRGLRELIRRYGVAPGAICHVGDAWPDARLAPLIGGFISLNTRSPRVRRVADAVLRSRDLRTLLPVLDGLRPRVPVNGALPLDEDSNTRPSDSDAIPDGVRRPRRAAPDLAQSPPSPRGR